MTHELTLTRNLNGDVSDFITALHEALSAGLGAKFNGVQNAGGVLTLIMEDTALPADDTQALGIASALAINSTSQQTSTLQAEETDLAGAAVSLLQTLIDDITAERQTIANRKAALQTQLAGLPASLNGTQASQAVALLANADIDIATALDNIDARQIKFARALAVLVKRSG